MLFAVIACIIGLLPALQMRRMKDEG